MSKLLILGGGFAGMWAALTAAREAHVAGKSLDVTLVSRDEYLTVRPRLYEPFEDGLRAPLRPVLEPVGVRFVPGEIGNVDAAARRVRVATGGSETTFDYDRLVLATGSVQRALPIPGAEFAYDIDTFAGAGRFDARLRDVLREPERTGALTFVIVGAGFTGIELATDMRRRIRVLADAALAGRARIVLVERNTMVGPDLGSKPRPILEAALRDVRVEVRLGVSLTAIDAEGVTLGGGERIASRTVIVAAGLAANPLTADLSAERDALGRVVVDDYLRVPTAPGVFAAGDSAHAKVDEEGHSALMSCQHACPMGKHAGYNASRELLGLEPRVYRQPMYVTCLDLGDAGAMLTSGWDREVQQTGEETKALKRTINTQWIYPPKGTREDILAASDIDGVWPPPT
ncbi:MAG: FAD-dependent oxidoreductase [Gammaproteobacteria bacterium]|nr:FAD-dependent oxidoreductase [Gammaproteobacteria bacterium]